MAWCVSTVLKKQNGYMIHYGILLCSRRVSVRISRVMDMVTVRTGKKLWILVC